MTYTARQLRTLANVLDALEQADKHAGTADPMPFRVEMKDNDGVPFGWLRCPDGLWIWEPPRG